MTPKSKTKIKTIVAVELIEEKIFLLRGRRVMFDFDLAMLYGVTTGNLNKAVNRNIERFPEDFMIKLSEAEYENLKFQFGISSWGGRRKPPNAFTEQGVAMLSSVLRSKRAILVNILIMRTFVRIREMLAGHDKLARKLFELEQKVASHDQNIQSLFAAIRQLLKPSASSKKQIGFHN
jgi:hypothetical protein